MGLETFSARVHTELYIKTYKIDILVGLTKFQTNKYSEFVCVVGNETIFIPHSIQNYGIAKGMVETMSIGLLLLQTEDPRKREKNTMHYTTSLPQQKVIAGLAFGLADTNCTQRYNNV